MRYECADCLKLFDKKEVIIESGDDIVKHYCKPCYNHHIHKRNVPKGHYIKRLDE